MNILKIFFTWVFGIDENMDCKCDVGYTKDVALRILVLVSFHIVTCGSLSVYEGRNCSLCPAGQLVQHHCTANQDTVCTPCPKGTYSNVPNLFDSCKPCRTECPKTNRAQSFVLRDCTDTQDIICSCGEGLWFDNTRGLCLPHSKCPPGLDVIKKGTSSSDVVCGVKKSWTKVESATTAVLSSTTVSTGSGKIGLGNTIAILVGISVASLCLISLTFTGVVFLVKRRKRRYAWRAEQSLLRGSEDELHSIMPDTIIETCNSTHQREIPSSIIDNLETFSSVNRRDVGFNEVVGGSNSLESPAEKNRNEQNSYIGCNTLPQTQTNKRNAPCLPVVCNWPKGKDFETHEHYKTYQYGSAGGELVLSPSVKVSIPPNSIKSVEVFGIKGGPVKNIDEFHDFFRSKEDEDVISPVYQIDVDERKQFSGHVRLVLKHCIQNPEAWKTIKVYHCPSADTLSQLTEVPLKSKNNNVVQPMYYVIENNQTVSIYTKHFSIFFSTGDRKRNITITAHVYVKECAKVPEGPPKSMKLRVHLSDNYHQIADDKFERFQTGMKDDGFKKVESKHLILPKVNDSDTTINVLLESRNWKRSDEKCGAAEELFPANQKVTVGHFVDSGIPVCAAEWILTNNQRQNSFKANLIFTTTYVPPKPKKSFLDSITTFFKQPEGDNHDDQKRRQPSLSERTALAIEFDLVCDMPKPKSGLGEMKVLVSEVTKDDWQKLLDIVAKEMRQHEYRPFGRSLGYSEGEVDTFTHRFPGNKEEVIRQICIAWRLANPNAQLRVFIEHLPDSVRNEIGDVIKGIHNPHHQRSRAHSRISLDSLPASDV